MGFAMSRFKILIGKVGLDGHDRGAKVVAAALRDAGFEVVYTGLHQTPERVVEAALQEDVDAVCLSILSGAHMTLFPRVKALLDAQGAEHVLVSGGGIIPEEDIEALTARGIGRLFPPGSSFASIIDYFQEEIPRRRADRQEREGVQ